MPNAQKPQLHGLSRTGRFGMITITIVDHGDNRRGNCDAEVIAQDRWLVMDPHHELHHDMVRESDLDFSQAMDVQRTPGEILLRRGSNPLRLWAVIHDLDRTPTCREQWIAVALLNLLRELAHRNLPSVSMPCLGCAQGVLDATQFLKLLASAIVKAPVVHRLQINLTAEPGDRGSLSTALQDLLF